MSGAIEMSRSCVEDTTVVYECVSAGQLPNYGSAHSSEVKKNICVLQIWLMPPTKA